MRNRKRNRLLADDNENPMSMLANLFDVGMVFAVALMVAIVAHFRMSEIFSSEDYTIVKNPGTPEMEVITRKGDTVTRMQATDDNGTSTRGERVGTAYRLANGDVIYVPD